GRLRDGGAAADAAQLSVHGAMRLSRLAGVESDQTVQQLALFAHRAVQWCRQRRDRFGPGLALPRLAQLRLARLALHQQFVDVLRLEESGNPDEFLLLRGAGLGELAELLPLEDD